MKRLAFLFVALLLSGVVQAIHGQQSGTQFDKAFAAADHKATVQGDLNGAIQQYKTIVSRAGRNRAVAAEALLRTAECYRKLGDAQARRIYERIVHEYGDQKNAVTVARTRLNVGGDPRTTGMLNKQVWTGPKVDMEGTVSPDGRYLSFVDWDTGDLALHDLATGADRRLTNKGSRQQSTDFAEESTISPDGGHVAYSWFDTPKNRYVVRVLTFDGTGAGVPRTIFDNDDVTWIGPYDWSPDGKWLAVALQRKDRTGQIGLLSVANSTLRVLKSVDWHGTTKLAFSPDGKFVAYDLAIDDSRQRDVFIMSTDATREIPAVTHPDEDVILGWSPDGKWLLFASDRGGAMGLWGVAMFDGRPAETQKLIKPDFGPRLSGSSLTKSGTLLYGIRRTAANGRCRRFL